jgi:hypothetical protein
MGILKGWNTLNINRNALASILQYYFDTVLFNSKNDFGDRPQVKTVKWDHVSDGLRIDFNIVNEHGEPENE